jgi:DNA (cytosine-5)-methyltransferase 1
MTRPRLLDLFCCAGGAAAGYHRAGFDVVGVDIEPQPRYPFEFVQADAMTFPLDGFDVVHASPPCQDHSSLAAVSGPHGTGWMLTATLERLAAAGVPYVVENVEGADMPGSLILCGTEFGLRSGGRWLKRHRRFLSNVWLYGAGGCHCKNRPIGGVYGTGGAGQNTRGFRFHRTDAATAMGIDWMTVRQLSQAIPPAYTEFIGEQILTHLFGTTTVRTAA